MAHFKYTARDNSGNVTSGVVEANDSKSAVGILRRKNLFIVSLNEAGPKVSFSLSKMISRPARVSPDDLVVFSRQLATVVEAGIPLVSALDIIGEQMEKPGLQAKILKIRDDVEAGASLSEAMAKDKEFFSSFFVNMIKAGETSGTLDEILERLAVYLEKSSNLQKKVRSALVYPGVVTTMAIVITLVLIIKVIPIFKDIYSGFDARLPTPTLILLTISDWVRGYFYVVAAVMAAAIFLASRYLKTFKGKRKWDNMKLKLPVFGPLLKKVAISKFTRTFSTLVKSGVPILNSLDIVGKTSGNIMVEEAVEKVKLSVKDGENMATPLSKVGIFPPMVVRMISVGEKTGELEKMLTKISDFYEEQVETAVSGLTSLIEPLIIAFLGIVIGGVVICMFMPIMQMSQLIKF